MTRRVSTWQFIPTPYPSELNESQWREAMSGVVELNLRSLQNTLLSYERELTDEREIVSLPTGVSVAAGELCCLSSTGDMLPASAADKTLSSSLLGIAVTDAPGNIEADFIIKGKIRDTVLQAGDKVYVSTASGQYSTAIPTNSGEIVRLIGYKLSNDVFYFDPDSTYIEV